MFNVLLIGNYPPPYGGVSHHVASIHKILRKRNIESIVINVSSSSAASCSDVIHSSSRIKIIYNILYYCRKSKNIHLHTNGHNFKSWLFIFICGLISKIYKKYSLVTFHSGLSPSYVLRMNRVFKALFVSSLNWYEKIIVVNSKIKAVLIENRIEEESIEIIPAYLGLQSEPKALDNYEIEKFMDSRNPLMSSIVAFRKEYNIDTLIALMENIINEYHNAGLVIIGAGEGYREIETQIKNKKLENNIFLVVDIAPTHVYDILKKSNIFLRLTDYDGDAISIREAQELGVPVIASKTDFRPEGVVTYEIGNKEDLYSKVSIALKSNLRDEVKAPQVGTKNVDRILSHYNIGKQTGDNGIITERASD